MTGCRVHRVRYLRLLRLPSAAAIATTAVVALALTAAAAALLPAWIAAAVPIVAAAGLAAYIRAHRARVALEVHLARALLRSRAGCPGEVTLDGLESNVRAEAAAGGVTRLSAGSWLDAIRGLGFVTGRDRGFQLDWLRRTAAGRLSEVCGATALPLDRDYRRLDFAGVAEQAVAALAQPERDLLEAFSSGVNAAWHAGGPPFECRFLTYRPEPWRPADSIMIGLLFFHALSWKEQSKRSEAVIRRVLPAPIAEFLLPGRPGADPPVPAQLREHRAGGPAGAGAGDRDDLVAVDSAIAGSNCWVRAGPRGPVLACDLHLPLGLPNPLYQVDLDWPGGRLHGLVAAGLPVVLTGGNGHIVWGVTNLHADVLDLTRIDGTGTGAAPASDRITVRGGAGAVVEIARDGDSLVSPVPLMGERVRVRWTGFDSRCWDLRLQRLAGATSVQQSLAILDRAQGIALNVLVADESGGMAQVATGLLPRRPSGSPDRAAGHLTGAERPRLTGPPDGTLVSANDHALPEHPYRIGYDLDPGHRARRIRTLLTDPSPPDLARMRAIAHDTRAELYLPYRDLAVAALRGRDDPVAAVLAGWNGHADPGSVGFAVLVGLRELLARRVLSPYLRACRDSDPGFRYGFQMIDRPLLAIIRSGDPSLLPPDAPPDAGWDGFITDRVREVVAELSAPAGRLPTWAERNRVGLRHPLHRLAPWAGRLLDVPARPMAGALHCVRTCVPGFSAVGRAVLRPGRHAIAEFETPGGQSGHPLSRHYRDRHRDWSRLAFRPPRPPRPGCRYVLRPAAAPGPAR